MTEATKHNGPGIPSVIADVSGQSAQTATYYRDVSEFNHYTLQMELTPGSNTITVKFYGTTRDDGTQDSSCEYQDLGSTIFGAASWSSSGHLIDDTGAIGGLKYIKIELVVVGAGADSAWKLFDRKW